MTSDLAFFRGRVVGKGRSEHVVINDFEIEAVKQLSSLLLDDRVTRILRNRCIINQEDYGLILNMKKRGENLCDIKNVLINGLKNNCTFDQLIKTLYDNNFIQLAEKLFICKIRCNNKMTVTRVFQSDTTDRRRTSKLFKRIKQCVQDKVFSNPCDYLRAASERKKFKISTTTDEQEIKRLQDEYIILKAVEMDACTNTTLYVSKDHPGYLEIENVIKHTSNKLLSEVLLYIRQSIAFSTTDQFDEAENMIKKALICAEMCGSCPEITDMLYKCVVVKLSILENKPNDEELFKSIIYYCQKGLWTLQEESEDDHKFWKKAFFIRMAFAYLRVGKSCRMVKNYVPNMNDIVDAERLLNDDILTDLEDRRQMLMAVAKARLNEFKGNVEQAILYLKEARKLAIGGRYAERDFLEEYEKSLEMARIVHNSENNLVIATNELSTAIGIMIDDDDDNIDSFPSLEHLHLSSFEND